jgi:hypothetical protein
LADGKRLAKLGTPEASNDRLRSDEVRIVEAVVMPNSRAGRPLDARGADARTLRGEPAGGLARRKVAHRPAEEREASAPVMFC